MTEEMKAKCDLLVKNRTAIRRKFLFENELMTQVSALVFTSDDVEADVKKMAECRKLLDRKTRPLSILRATVELLLLSKMSLAADPAEYLSDVKKVYGKIQKGQLLENAYMALAAILIVDLGRREDSDEIVAKYRELISRMNKDHPILTDSEDTSFAAFLALTDKSADTILSDLETGYNYMKKTCKFKASGNAIYELCEMLALTYGDMEEKCDKVMRIYSAFAKRKAEYGNGQEFSSLGALIDVDLDIDTMVDSIVEAEHYLKCQKVFGDKDEEKKSRLVYAAFLVADVYGRSTDPMSNAIATNTLTMIRAKKISTVISVIGSVAPSVISSMLPSEDSKEKTDEGEKDGAETKEESKDGK
ncbi:MAG: DUF4003 family protein [Clostridiales bacterium]|nr:DUF4003 family protein [Clostridiales bacterium]